MRTLPFVPERRLAVLLAASAVLWLLPAPLGAPIAFGALAMTVPVVA